MVEGAVGGIAGGRIATALEQRYGRRRVSFWCGLTGLALGLSMIFYFMTKVPLSVEQLLHREVIIANTDIRGNANAGYSLHIKATDGKEYYISDTIAAEARLPMASIRPGQKMDLYTYEGEQRILGFNTAEYSARPENALAADKANDFWGALCGGLFVLLSLPCFIIVLFTKRTTAQNQ